MDVNTQKLQNKICNFFSQKFKFNTVCAIMNIIGVNDMKNTGYPTIDKLHEKDKSILEKHPIIPNVSIYNMINVLKLIYKDNIAIDCLELRVTYKKLLETSKIISKSFKELGIKENDIITVSMPNYYQAVAIFLAANRIGAVTSFLNPGCTKEEIEYYLNLFESPLFINYDKTIEYNKSIKEKTKVKQIITLDQKDLNKNSFLHVSNKKIGNTDFISFNELELVADYYDKHIKTNFNKKQNALILFTSGSTGYPKSVVLTNENVLASGIYMKHTGNIKTKIGEKCLICVPFGYPYGFSTSMLMSLICGRESILAPNLDHRNINYFLKKNPNYIFGSPAVLEMIKRNTEENLDLSSIHSFISGGDFLSSNQAESGVEFFKKHNAQTEIYNGSGNAESAGASTIAVGSKIKRETVGKVLVGSTALILDPKTNKEKKYNEEGNLYISGKHVFKEYYKEPDLTFKAKKVYEGKVYLDTGAIGYLDEEGYFIMTGRASRFFIRSDSNKVYLEHIQKILSYLDCVEKCAAVPKPNEELLYESKAYIVLKEGYKPTEELKQEILKKLEEPINSGSKIEQLKTYEIPKSIEFVEDLQYTKADKIDYKKLEEQTKQEYEKEKQYKIGGIK